MKGERCLLWWSVCLPLQAYQGASFASSGLLLDRLSVTGGVSPRAYHPVGLEIAQDLTAFTHKLCGGAPFLSTHPGVAERSKAANDASLKVNGSTCSG